MLPQRPRGRDRVRPATANGDDIVIGFDHVSVTADHEEVPWIGNREQRVETAQVAVGPPVLGQLDGGPGQVPREALELFLEFLEQREGIGHRARETGQDGAVFQLAYLPGGRLHNRVAHRDLAVPTQRDATVAADRHDRGAAEPVALLHAPPSLVVRTV